MFNHSFLDPQLMGIWGVGVVLILVFDSIMSCSWGGGGVKNIIAHIKFFYLVC